MWANLEQKRLYGLVFSLSALLVVIAIGGGLFNQPGFWFEHWQHKVFSGLCHQDPQRSFWINGTPMAVCARCFGIYSAICAGWIAFPIIPKLLQGIDVYKRWMLSGIILLNIFDVLGNYLGLWQNTLLSRFVLGFLVGLTAVFVIGYELLGITQQNIKGINYGTDRTTT